jgi:hypothetical protein
VKDYKQTHKEGGADSLGAGNKGRTENKQEFCLYKEIGSSPIFVSVKHTTNCGRSKYDNSTYMEIYTLIPFVSCFNKMEDAGAGIKIPSGEMAEFFE